MPLKPNHINPAPAASPEPSSVSRPKTVIGLWQGSARKTEGQPPPVEGCNSPRSFCPPLVPGTQKEHKRNTFRFKQFAVTQEQAAMKVGTDGVLLGAWVSLPSIPLTPAPVRILDIGTGTGVIALMMAQRTASLSPSPSQVHVKPIIDAVEVDPAAFEEACGNFVRSPWAPVLRGIHMPIQEYAALTTTAAAAVRYDLIVSNPPYFVAGLDFKRGFCDPSTGVVTMPSVQRIAARHAEMLPYDQLIDAVLTLLESEHGRFAAIFPYQESGIFIAKAAAKGLYCHRQLHVQGAPHKPVKRVAAEFSLRRNPKGTVVRETLCIEDGLGEFSGEYRALTRDFYVHF